MMNPKWNVMKRVRAMYLIGLISIFLIKTSLNRFDRNGNEPLAKQGGDIERRKSVMQSFERHIFECVFVCVCFNAKCFGSINKT